MPPKNFTDTKEFSKITMRLTKDEGGEAIAFFSSEETKERLLSSGKQVAQIQVAMARSLVKTIIEERNGNKPQQNRFHGN